MLNGNLREIDTSNRYKLIAFDMDGTLLNSRQEITPRTAAAVNRACSVGRGVAICTGRGDSKVFIINDLLKNLDTIWLGVIGSLVAAAIVFILNQVYSSVNRSIKISEIVERRIRDEEVEYITAVDPSCPQASVYYGETPQSQPFYKGCMIQL